MPARKSPHCRTCGTPMAGHKRPNRVPVCPVQNPVPAAPEPIPRRGAPLRRRAVEPEPGPDLRLPLNGHWRNPNWVDPVPRVQVEDDRSNHSSWVSTEVDSDSSSSDDGSQDGSEENFLQDDDDDVRSISALSSSSSSSSSARSSSSSASASSAGSSLSQLVGKCVPLASVWAAPTRDIPAISHAANKAGVDFCVVRNPKSWRRRVVKRDASRAHGDGLERQNSWWLVMGQDSRAVTGLIAKTEPDAGGQEDEEQDARTSGLVGAYPIHHSYLRPTFLDVLIAGAVGGFVMFYALSVL
ncbi:hypothetical protein DAEQUDRAFT_488828 [Daedalea quercina L-15889]|uniref:Uncharacterized protein n=1 Tax=Daedalea quercina L-15889 TaxID=1314783 RepID=A0A165MRX2_9APHY|nr:hypothetical protein DAEQUDRAFT_488828 [Daedalea quercina L-15889]